MVNIAREIAAATFDYVESSFSDIATDNVQLLRLCKGNGMVKPCSGGDFIRENLIYQGNGTYTRYSEWDTININPRRVLDAAQFPWKFVAGTVSINGTELVKVGNDKARILDLMQAKVAGLQADYSNGMGTDVHSDGTASGGKQITGFRALIPDDPTLGVVGGVDASLAANAWWRPVKFAGVADGSAAVSATTIQNYIIRILNQITRNGESPDMAIADSVYWTYLWESLSSIARTGPADQSLGKAVDKPLEFMGLKVYNGSGKGGKCPANHLYIWSGKHIKWRPHSDRQFKKDEDRHPTNQDGFVRPYLSAGNLTTSNRSLCGVLIA